VGGGGPGRAVFEKRSLLKEKKQAEGGLESFARGRASLAGGKGKKKVLLVLKDHPEKSKK